MEKDVDLRRRYQGATIADDDAAEGRDSIRRTLGQSASIFKPGELFPRNGTRVKRIAALADSQFISDHCRLPVVRR